MGSGSLRTSCCFLFFCILQHHILFGTEVLYYKIFNYHDMKLFPLRAENCFGQCTEVFMHQHLGQHNVCSFVPRCYKLKFYTVELLFMFTAVVAVLLYCLHNLFYFSPTTAAR